MMKHRIISLLTITTIVLTFFTACRKEAAIQNNGIVGNWKLVEYYGGYANGGNYTWDMVDNESSHTLLFSNNGQYKRNESANGNYQECLGKYTLVNSTNLEINTNCNTVPEKMLITELTATSLIIDRRVIEGVIRYKYAPTE